MSGFEVEHEELQRARQLVGRTAEDLNEGQRRLGHSVGDFLGAGWTGSAAESFADAWHDWCVGAEDVAAALATMTELLGRAEAVYQAVDAGAQEQFAPLNADLQGRLG